MANGPGLPGGIGNFLNNQGDDYSNNPQKPKAYLNYILFDEQFNMVQSASGYDPVGQADELKTHALLNLPITKSGYLYVYVSNETTNTPVYFDNLTVLHRTGPLLQEDDYYPFGLEMKMLGSKAAGKQENKLKYNGKELQSDFDLEWTDYGARMYDGQIGRWHVVDPMADNFVYETPYNYAGNNPIRNIDVNGKYKLPKNIDKKYANEYKLVSKLLNEGLFSGLSKNILAGLMKYGQLSERDVSYITKKGQGPTIVLENIFYNANGHYTNTGNGLDAGQIEINPILVKQILSAKTSKDKSVALLAFYMTVLHETVHHGDYQDGKPNDGNQAWYDENGRFYGDSHEKGDAFSIDLFFNKDPFANRNEQGTDGLENIKKVFDRKNSTEDGKKDLPTMKWSQFGGWLNNTLSINPNIKVTIQ